jgi:hypothetical protein
MTTWLPIVVVIAAVLAAGFLKEHFRVSGVERWARAKGFTRLVPFTPAADAPVTELAASLHQRGARLWSIGLEGMVDASPCTIAEYSAAKPGTRTGEEWFTLVTWPSARPRADGSSLGPGPSEWPHEGVLVRVGHLVGWRLPGMMTAAKLDQVIKLTPEARQRSA